MCGIAGFVGVGTTADVRAMADALAHRGPDGCGYYQDPVLPVFLGHRRLAIVDLEHGAQPMWDGEGEVGVIFNGEIYNHAELRRELQREGYKFRSDHSDTEVLVHGWKEWGRDLPARLNGMFAFAIWDRSRKVLFMARDRFGEKPLYWAHKRGLFLFASELRAFRAHGAFLPEVDTIAVAKLLAYGFIPAPNCLYRDCRKLPAGHWLELDAQTGQVETREYWRFTLEPADKLPTEQEAAEHLQTLLRRAVEIRMMSDVPLGIFLSGGIDSSTVAALAAKTASLNTFSVGFAEPSFDESFFAGRMAEVIGANHHQQCMSMDEARLLTAEVLRRLDEPIGDPSIVATFLLSRFTARYVKVALSGDGGDELFAGYDTFAALGLAGLYHRVVPGIVHKGLVRLADWLPLSNRNMSLDFKLRRALSGVAAPPSQWNARWLGPLPPEAIAEVLQMPTDPTELYAEAVEAWRATSSMDPIDKALEFYTRFYFQDDILPKLDRASMMNGLEARAVFVDQDLVEFVRKLPARYKYRRGVRKFLLKRAMSKVLPDDIIARPKKGFGIPIKDWLSRMPAAAPAAAVPNADFGAVALRDREHRIGKADHRLFLWVWCVLQHHEMAPLHTEAARPAFRSLQGNSALQQGNCATAGEG